MQTVYVMRDGQVARFPNLAAAKGEVPEAAVYWVDLVEPTDPERAALVEIGLAPEALADALDWEDRPAARELPEAQVVTFRVFRCEGGDFDIHPLHVLVKAPVVATIRSGPDPGVETLQGEIARHPAMLSSVGHLTYLVLDAVVDSHFPALDNVEDMLEHLDETILERASTESLPAINQIKRMLLTIRRSVSPERDAVNSLILSRPDFLEQADVDDLRDLYYRLLQVVELAETYRDLLGDSLAAYLANVSNRLSGIMKILTMISTVFLPLTLIVGFFGTNFTHMLPPYEAKWGMPAMLTLMVTVALGMLWWFRRKTWL